MTTAAENLQQALQRSWAAWALWMRTSRTVAQEMVAAVAEWAYDEVPIKSSSIECDVQPAHLTKGGRLVPRLYGISDPTQTPIDAKYVTIEPAGLEMPARGARVAPVTVTVTISMPSDLCDKAYLGSLCDEAGAEVEPDVYISMLK
jgi:hypothetical protein